MVAAVESMAFNKVEAPWHGLGTPVEWDMTPDQMLVKAGLNWTVSYAPGFIWVPDGDNTGNNGWITRPLDRGGLLRSSDLSILDNRVNSEWNIVQNHEAAKFFCEMVEEGSMHMETAGSLDHGRIVWFLARVDQSFDVYKGKDEVKSYLLFTNPHKYGMSTCVMWTPIRVVCLNTLMMALSGAKDRMIRISHRKEFIASEVKMLLKLSEFKMEDFKEKAQFLAESRIEEAAAESYFKELLPSLSKEDPDQLSRNAQTCLDLRWTQPGCEMTDDSLWGAFNAFTYFTDHLSSKDPDVRLTKSWVGTNRAKKVKAFELALEYGAYH